jgi:phage terminase small subunit
MIHLQELGSYLIIVYLKSLQEFTMQENHKRFADKYFETLNGKESAIYAGFSEDTARQKAWQLLQREDIQEYLQSMRAEYAEKSGISKQWIIERFKTISDRCIQEEPVLDSKGEPTGEFRFDSSGANNATAHLGKIIGIFEKDNEQTKINLSIPAPVIYNTAPPLANNENEIDNV